MKTDQKLALLVVALLALATSTVALSRSALANGTCDFDEYQDGVQVTTLADLECLRAYPVGYYRFKIYQRGDIELNDWNTPISGWYGTFDGGGFRLTDNVSSAAQTSLFYNPEGPLVINNLHRSGAVSDTRHDVGGFVGYSEKAIRIADSSMTGDVSGTGGSVGGLIGAVYAGSPVAVEIIDSHMNGDVTGAPVGGLVGVTEGAIKIRRSSMTGNVASLSNSGSAAGGFVGSARAATGISDSTGDVTISYSYSKGDISAVGTATGIFTAAGFVGSAAKLTISNSYSIGNVSIRGSVNYAGAGGFVGYASEFIVNQSYADTDVTLSHLNNEYAYAGGFAGSTFGTSTVNNSFSIGNVRNEPGAGVVGAGGFIGILGRDFALSIVRSYSTGDVITDSGAGLSFPGEFVGDNRETPFTLVNSFCLAGATNCGFGEPAVAKPAAELKSTEFLSGQDWDFRKVWCNRDSLNDGYPVLRAIDFGPGDTDCPPRRSPAALQSVTLDPAGGVCGSQSSPWTQTVRGSFTLPTADACKREGYAFLGWTRNPSLTTPEYLLTTSVTRSGALTAVWGALPAAPTRVDVIANFLCLQICTSAIVVWPTSTNPTDTAQITIDNLDAICSLSGQVFGLRWCWVANLAAGSTHTTSIAWRNQNGIGPTTNTTFTLN